MSAGRRERIGIDYKNGQRGLSSTANGVVPAYRVSLASVRIGDVEVYDVEAIVLPSADALRAAGQQLPVALPDEARERHDVVDEKALSGACVNAATLPPSCSTALRATYR